MDIEQFIQATIQMPGLKDVFAGVKREDYILIRGEMIRQWGIDNFNLAVERLSIIVMPLNIRVWLNAPITNGESYTLCVMKLNIKSVQTATA